MEPRTSHKWGKCSTYQDTHFNNHPVCSRVCEPWSTSNLGSPPLSHALWDPLVSPASIHKHPHPRGTLIRNVPHTVIRLEQRVGHSIASSWQTLPWFFKFLYFFNWFSFLRYILFYMCLVCVFVVHVCVTYVCRCPWKPEELVGSPGAGLKVSHPVWVLIWSSLRVAVFLSTEPSLQLS